MAFAAAVIGCQVPEMTEPQYVPGEADNAFCYGVSFPKQDAAGSHTFDPEATKVITLTAKRTNTFGDITVPVEVVDTAGVFTVAPIVFADGQEETTFDITFATVDEGGKVKNGVTYAATININDTEYASIYGSGAKSIAFNVMVVTWQDFLDPATKEPAIITLYEGWWNEVHQATMKFYEVDGIRTCFLTSIEKDDDGNPTGIWGDDQNIGMLLRWYVADRPSGRDPSKTLSHKNNLGFDFVEVPKQYFGFDYADWASKPEAEAANPIYVYDYHHYWIERGYSVEDLGGSWLDEANDEGSPDEGYPMGYYDGKGGFYLNLRYYIPGLGGFSPDPYEFVAIASGFVRTDFSIALDTDFSSEGKTPVFVTAGADVATVKYAVYPGELTSTQAANKEPGITDGTENPSVIPAADLILDDEDNMKYATLLLEPETSGIYTVVAVSYDEQAKEGKDVDYVVINHVAAADTLKRVVVQVGVEDVPARYTEFDNISAFGYYVLGQKLTEVHAAVVETAKYEKAVDTYNAAVKETASLALSASALAQVNATGGYFTLATGLAPLTSYTVIVWATNGYLDKIVTAERTTDGLPLELVCNGTYTYAAWWEGADDKQKLYSDPNYENTYVLPNWGGGVSFIFEEKDKEIYIPTFYIGSDHSSYGPVYYVDPLDYYSAAQIEADPTRGEVSYIDDEGVYHFHFVLAVSAGSFGHFWETYTPDAPDAPEAGAPAFKIQSLGQIVESGKLNIPNNYVEVERDAKSVKVAATVSYERKDNSVKDFRVVALPSVK